MGRIIQFTPKVVIEQRKLEAGRKEQPRKVQELRRVQVVEQYRRAA